MFNWSKELHCKNLPIKETNEESIQFITHVYPIREPVLGICYKSIGGGQIKNIRKSRYHRNVAEIPKILQ